MTEETEASAAMEAVLARAVALEVESLDLGALVVGATRDAVKKQISAFAKDALETVMTPERIEELRTRTSDAVEESLADVSPDDVDEEPPAELVYGSTEQWLTDWLVPTYRRYLSPNGSQATWCASWWKHAEAVMRLEALWRAWEHLRLDGQTGMSVWWKDHADYHLAILLHPDGPFKGCTFTEHTQLLPAFALVEAPEGFFPDERPGRDETPNNETEEEVNEHE